MRRLLSILCTFLILFISISLLVLPVILSLALNSWYWLILYSIHLITIIAIALVYRFAPEGIEEKTHV